MAPVRVLSEPNLKMFFLRTQSLLFALFFYSIYICLLAFQFLNVISLLILAVIIIVNLI